MFFLFFGNYTHNLPLAKKEKYSGQTTCNFGSGPAQRTPQQRRPRRRLALVQTFGFSLYFFIQGGPEKNHPMRLSPEKPLKRVVILWAFCRNG